MSSKKLEWFLSVLALILVACAYTYGYASGLAYANALYDNGSCVVKCSDIPKPKECAL